MENLEIKHGKERFYIGNDEGIPLAELSYVLTGEDKVIVDRTWVDKKLEGQGVAGRLLDAFVEWARKENRQVLATCSYAVHKLEDTPEYQDVYLK
ncbi:MAG: GNAT family N-acetyltransferase [Tissierellia bacterium]|nr:GNAT family N-acetyltransferase [Tissierellia bacterium]